MKHLGFLELTSILVILLFTFFLSTNITFAAGGTCNNNPTGGTQAGVTCTLVDNCEDGYLPVIKNKSQTSCGSCTCTPPSSNPSDSCGGTSQPCCNPPLNPCDNAQLTCKVTAAGNKCLDQAQIDELPDLPDANPSGDPITLSAEPCDYNGSKGIQTALGCIPYEPVSLIGWVLRWAIGVGGGIAFLLMAFASYQLMTSAGNPERLKAGQEMFVSAGAGLLFIIFSVFLLQLIGADILKIPGFNP